MMGWKRRARAASFSMSRYSLVVVAPTQQRSPRASCGFSRLEASTAPGMQRSLRYGAGMGQAWGRHGVGMESQCEPVGVAA
eukprot:scaffold19784_cov57-Phaeocystis_antarctica.AAC.2